MAEAVKSNRPPGECSGHWTVPQDFLAPDLGVLETDALSYFPRGQAPA